MLGNNRNNQRRANQRSTADVGTQYQKQRVDPAIVAAKRFVKDVAQRKHHHDRKNNRTEYAARQGNQTDHTQQLGHNHNAENFPQVRPVHRARLRVAAVLQLAMIQADGDGGKDQQMHRDQRQKDQRIVVYQQQKRQRQYRAAKAQSGAHNPAPDKNQANEHILVQREIVHRRSCVSRRRHCTGGRTTVRGRARIRDIGKPRR